MHIEIVSGHEGVRSYYKIDGPDTIIGSSKECHLILPFPEISRRHLSLLKRGDRFFIIDHGSTNGTFMNEERLSPGVKTEWELQVPIRLAGQVLLTLTEVASEDGDRELYRPENDSRADQTRVMKIPKDLKTTQRSGRVPQKKLKPKKKGMGKSFLIVLAFLAGAWYLHGLLEKRKEALRKKAPPSKSAVKSN